KDNTPHPSPLVDFKPEANVKSVWYKNAGHGSNGDYVKLNPSIAGNTIFTTSKNGFVAANDKITGKSIWQTNTENTITGGTAVDDHLVYVGTRKGQIIALNQTDGKIVWKAMTPSEILAPTATKEGITVVKTIDGSVSAYNALHGESLWHYQQTEPNLILRGGSAPKISGNSVVVGFANGTLTKLNLRKGGVQWEKTIAEPRGIFAIQRMVDIDADPVVKGDRVYAATYQGRIAALDLNSSRSFWTQDISSYTGIAVDDSQVYVSDARSRLWAFNTRNGTVNWQQDKLTARVITGPIVMGNYIVVGDAEGYLHWMSKQDGHFIARVFVNRSGILATPIVDNNVLYVYTKNGRLAAYTLA
ncbi:MAG TPA: outer membrane protein assembly factor BamB, partial [Gammaproteobacteria bacterium]|nr:outer membrane protein assembly factor BamB [Gammaproteobacteria bacterium]